MAAIGTFSRAPIFIVHDPRMGGMRRAERLFSRLPSPHPCLQVIVRARRRKLIITCVAVLAGSLSTIGSHRFLLLPLGAAIALVIPLMAHSSLRD